MSSESYWALSETSWILNYYMIARGIFCNIHFVSHDVRNSSHLPYLFFFKSDCLKETNFYLNT